MTVTIHTKDKMTEILSIKPTEIEAMSFAIIEDEFAERTGKLPADFPPEQFSVIQRVIHATGDFTFADSLVFHPEAIKTAITVLQQGKNIITDVNMVAAGINKKTLGHWGGKVICKIADPEIAALALQNSSTRSETAIIQALECKPGIAAIGNAPTALIKLLQASNNQQIFRPDLIVGVPVGFVNAAESKELLAYVDLPFITCLGRKGGSPVAAAIINALMKLATQSA